MGRVYRAWLALHEMIDLQPIYHRIEERIRGHVILCWLALLLIRITETTTSATWPTIRQLDRLCLGTFTGPTCLFRQATALTKPPDRPAGQAQHPLAEADQRARTHILLTSTNTSGQYI